MQPEMSPRPQRAAPGRGGRVPNDDIELPPLPVQAVGDESSARQTEAEGLGEANRPRPIRSLLWCLGLAGLVAAGAWLFQSGSATESSHPNWNQVAAATEASRQQGTPVFVQRDGTGSSERLNSAIELTDVDVDQVLTFQVRDALLKGRLDQANAALHAAQNAAGAATASQPELLLNSDAVAAIRDGRARFYRLSLADSCDADGDVVSFSVSGQSPWVVPISHTGSSLTFLLMPGAKTITLRGEYDGGGGITVMFQSSQGHFLSRTMEMGGEYDIQIVVK